MQLEMIGSATTGFSAHGENDATDPVCKACPFCGSLDVKVENTHTPHYTAECQACGAQGPGMTAPDHLTATKRKGWNRVRGTVERLHRAAFDAAVKAWNERR